MYKNKNLASLALLPTQMTTPSFILDGHEYASPGKMSLPKTPTEEQMLLFEAAWNMLRSPALVPSTVLNANALFCGPVPEVLARKAPHDITTADLILNLLFDAPWEKGQIDSQTPPHWWVYSSRIGTANEGIWRRFIGTILMDEVTVSAFGSGEVDFYEYGSASYSKIPTIASSAVEGGPSIFLRLPGIQRPGQEPVLKDTKSSQYYFGYASYSPTPGPDMSSFTSLFRLVTLEDGPRNASPQCPKCCRRTCVSKSSCVCGCTCQRQWNFILQEVIRHRKVDGRAGKCSTNLSTKFVTLATGHACSDGVAIMFNYKTEVGEAQYQSDPAIRAREMIILKWIAVELRSLFRASFTVRSPETTPLLESKNPFERQVVVNRS